MAKAKTVRVIPVTSAERGATEVSWFAALTGVLVVLSAFAVIQSTHACRELYASLQSLESSQWHLQEDYSRLLLEQSTWASHHRVEKVARDDLGMRAPDLAHLKVVPR